MLFFANKIFSRLPFFFLILIISSCTKLLEPFQIKELKAGHLFWEWNSSYGAHQVHYIEKGTGSNHIILIHGFGGHSFTWRFIIDQLAEAGYHIWSIDLLGFGLSDKPLGAPYGLDLFRQQITDFIISKKIGSAHLIGNSMGGGLCLGMAVEHPQMVKSLVLIDPFAYPQTLPMTLKITKFAGKAASPFQGDFMVRRVLEEVMYDPSKVTHEQVDAYTLPFRMPGGIEAFISTLQNFDNNQIKNLSKKYSKISVPLLLIWGREDSWIPISTIDLFRKDFPKAEVLIIPQCGHIPQEECPEAVLDSIKKFLK